MFLLQFQCTLSLYQIIVAGATLSTKECSHLRFVPSLRGQASTKSVHYLWRKRMVVPWSQWIFESHWKPISTAWIQERRRCWIIHGKSTRIRSDMVGLIQIRCYCSIDQYQSTSSIVNTQRWNCKMSSFNLWRIVSFW